MNRNDPTGGFDDALAELNDVVTILLGHALLLAREHRPEIEPELRRTAERYVELAGTLRSVGRTSRDTRNT